MHFPCSPIHVHVHVYNYYTIILYCTIYIYMYMYMCVCVPAARNKDNSWPEEIIAVMKEVREKDKESKENKDANKQHHSGERVRG